MKRSIHVFASDFLAYPGLPRTAGGNRSRQVISALRKAGHKVTFSFPLHHNLFQLHGTRIRAELTAEEMWCCEHFFEPDVVLNRVQPEIAVYCNVNTFRTMRRFAREIVHIVDLCGPVQFESFLVQSTDYETAMRDGEHLEACCREMVEKLRFVDYIVTVSERQKYFWAGYCSMAGFNLHDINAVVCPCSFDLPVEERNPSARISMVYSSGFYPWQNPRSALYSLVEILDRIEDAVLHIFGAPHAGVPNADEARRLIDDLRSHPCVRYHGYASAEELSAVLATAWCGIELMEQTIERELAITGSTVHFLSTGTPVIYNNYSTLSDLIRQYGAGWTVSPGDASALRNVVNELIEGGLPLVEEISLNARRLAGEQFAPHASMSPLLELCQEPLRKRSIAVASSNSGIRKNHGVADKPIANVLTITPGAGALLELRIANPLRSLQRAARISSFVNYNPFYEELPESNIRVDAIIMQRSVPDYLYRALSTAGIPFLLDVDDNLLANAVYRTEPIETAVVEGLARAAVVTTPNPRLVRLLEKYSGLKLDHRSYITPNALPFPSEGRIPQRPSQLIWIQSDIAALSDSREAVVQAVEDFSCKYRLPLILIGKNVLKTPRFSHQVVLGQIDFAENLRLLETSPTSIGIAPLETSADQETLDFVAGKSDLKILLFGGYGHPAVYSAAPPYTDSALQTGSVIENTYTAWIEALEFQYHEGWRLMGEQSLRIRQERHIDKVAVESWAPALESCVLEKPIRTGELYEIVERALRDGLDVERRGGSTADRINSDLQLANHDLHREIQELRHSLSWRITAPIRSLAKPILEWRRTKNVRLERR
jgi:glycosyltransferase involved in cell wall biosynthesis